MATCRAASWSQSAIRVRQRGSVKPRCSMFAGPPGPGPRSGAHPRSRSVRWPRAGPGGPVPATCTRSSRRWRAGRLLPAAGQGRAAPPVGQPHLGRAQPGAAGAQECAQFAAPVPHRTAGGAGLLITGRRTHDEPRIPHLPGHSQVVALPGAAGAGRRILAGPH
jgi:hypothetical protein